jgi:hypothetical protein
MILKVSIKPRCSFFNLIIKILNQQKHRMNTIIALFIMMRFKEEIMLT